MIAQTAGEADTRWIVAWLGLLTVHGKLILATAAGGAFAVAFLLALSPLPSWCRLLLAALGPVAGVVLFASLRPDRGCDHDCQGHTAWAVTLGLTVAAWMVGAAWGSERRRTGRRVRVIRRRRDQLA